MAQHKSAARAPSTATVFFVTYGPGTMPLVQAGADPDLDVDGASGHHGLHDAPGPELLDNLRPQAGENHKAASTIVRPLAEDQRVDSLGR